MLSALNAARLDKATYLPEVRRYITAMGVYWIEAKGISGYDVLPKPKQADRYHDDNEWIVLDLADAYDLTQDPEILEWAKETFRFVMSGSDDKLYAWTNKNLQVTHDKRFLPKRSASPRPPRRIGTNRTRGPSLTSPPLPIF